MGGGVGGWEEKRGFKLTSAKVEVEVEAELGNYEQTLLVDNIQLITDEVNCLT